MTLRGITCRRLRALLHQHRPTLSDAQRLKLEEHLDSCGACAADVRALRLIQSLAASLPRQPLSPRSREGAIAGAFTAQERAAVPAKSERRGWHVVPLAIATAAAAAAVLLLFGRGELPDEATLGSRIQPAARATDRVVKGTLQGAERVFSADDPIPTDVSLSAPEATAVEVPGARVDIEARATVSWARKRRTLRLHRGAVGVDVTPGQTTPFRVETDRFVVEVLGTKFRVESERVSVQRGAVRIVSPNGEVLVDRLRAGQSWRASEIPAPAPAPVPPTPAPVSDSVAALLQKARAHLGEGDVVKAHRDARHALELTSSRRQTAEAHTILAECAQLAGQPRAAAERYLLIARQYANLEAGETALFAAARIEANAGRLKAAKRLFLRYLARYPEGRLRGEAEQRLRAIGSDSAQ
jgi:hypothetical protein